MTDAHEPRSDYDAEDAVARLLQAAGRRLEPPAAAYERALHAATAAWQAKVRRRNRARLAGAIAASVLIAALSILFVRGQLQAPAMLAGRTDRIIGALEARLDDGTWMSVNVPAELRAATQLRTAHGNFAGVVLANGASLRLAEATSLVLESDSRVRLLSGKIYLDTGARPHSRRLEVVTAAGSAIDIGTQFEVLYRDDSYRLRVREGRVRLSRALEAIESRSGEQVTIDAQGIIERRQLKAGEADWQWTQALAPAPDIDGRPLTVLLEWVARETGKTIRFEQPELERRAQTTILHGSIRLLAPLDALSVMLATTDLEHLVVDDRTILIRLKAAN